MTDYQYDYVILHSRLSTGFAFVLFTIALFLYSRAQTRKDWLIAILTGWGAVFFLATNYYEIHTVGTATFSNEIDFRMFVEEVRESKKFNPSSLWSWVKIVPAIIGFGYFLYWLFGGIRRVVSR